MRTATDCSVSSYQTNSSNSTILYTQGKLVENSPSNQHIPATRSESSVYISVPHSWPPLTCAMNLTSLEIYMTDFKKMNSKLIFQAKKRSTIIINYKPTVLILDIRGPHN